MFYRLPNIEAEFNKIYGKCSIVSGSFLMVPLKFGRDRIKNNLYDPKKIKYYRRPVKFLPKGNALQTEPVQI